MSAPVSNHNGHRPMPAPRGELTIRGSTTGDRRALTRLAQLDSAAPPEGDHLLAEEDGELRAAVPLAGGRPIADPFHRTAELVAMLELRAPRLRLEAAVVASRSGAHRRAKPKGRGAALNLVRPAAH